ncbi:hypothetical protein J6590_028084, partial [Homalodisca vitripennis]
MLHSYMGDGTPLPPPTCPDGVRGTVMTSLHSRLAMLCWEYISREYIIHATSCRIIACAIASHHSNNLDSQPS